eukprot:Blabericola_migrator_1__12808@NODE_825_length_6370_cov_320_094241_g582_i0_p5_GENE_NODE_825_length_6370_cov_320_094241_g582_i0NODE_825_length_6370_cov_320_094241_g582_i0_p5_ORF_typecomplete_len197_score20_87Archease/PF01951_16/6_4e39_NODE_825_length_6370_cov_320_094241_g582_i016342224
MSIRTLGGLVFTRKEPRERPSSRRGDAESPCEVDAGEDEGEVVRTGDQAFLDIPIGSYTYEDHTADIRVKATGSSLGSSLKALGLGMFNYMSDVERIQPVEAREITVNTDSLESFVFHFLDELLGLYGETYFMVSRIEFVRLETGQHSYELKAVCFGEKFDRQRHEQGTEVKAITMHDFCYEEGPDSCTLTVLLDI